VYRVVITPEQQKSEQILLNSQQQHYLHRVVRLKEGDRFIAMDGEGKSWIAQLEGNYAQILEKITNNSELPISVTLMIALPKGNGFDEIIRCCTELGVTTFIPVISDRTLLKPSDHKLERWRRIAQEASEQSERQWVPQIVAPLNFTTALTTVAVPETACYICVARGSKNHLLNDLQNTQAKQLVIATGSEGGWTPQEVESAIKSGFKPVSLGCRILRAVTAPIVALSLVAAIAENPKY
jgi:16S rRNA (uracil1498-N3)-methyltransferase